MHVRQLFVEQADQWGISEAEPVLNGLLPYAGLLSSYDTANVIGTRDPDTLLLDHVLDSLSCFLFRPLWQARSLVDVGSGAGLPGIPLKIASPKMSTTLIESTGKKARFLELATQTLGLSDATVKNQRVEEVAFEQDQRSGYDVATARAVSSLPVLAEYCVPLIREEGHVIAMKGELSAKELEKGERAAAKLGARLVEIISVPMNPEMRARDRNLVILQKVNPTPDAYPRRAGRATRRPLGEE